MADSTQYQGSFHPEVVKSQDKILKFFVEKKNDNLDTRRTTISVTSIPDFPLF